MIDLPYMRNKIWGFLFSLVLAGFFITNSQVFAQTTSGGSGSITSVNPSSCQSFPCSVSISWAVTSNPDDEEIQLANNGAILSTSVTGSNQAFNIPFASSLILNVGTKQVDSRNISLTAPMLTSTPIPTSLPPIPTTKTCNQTCGASNEVCQSGLYCATVSSGAKYCRLQAYPDRTDCSVPGYSPSTQGSSNAPTPTISASVLGAKTASYVSPSPIASATAVPSQVLGESTDSLSPSTNEATPTPQESGSWLVNNLFLKIIAGLGGIIILVSLAVMIKLNGRSNSV